MCFFNDSLNNPLEGHNMLYTSFKSSMGLITHSEEGPQSLSAPTGHCARKTEARNNPSEEADCMHFTASICCTELIPQSEEDGAHSLCAPIVQSSRETEAPQNYSETDGMNFTASKCHMDQIPQTEEGGIQSLSVLVRQCAWSLVSLNSILKAGGMHFTSPPLTVLVPQ
jgi:hypothetical protein